MPNPIQSLLGLEMFHRADTYQYKSEIILWWEKRRFAYNLIIGVTGVVTCIVVTVICAYAEHLQLPAPAFPDPPLFVIPAIIFYGIMANVCFTGGWIVEVFVVRRWKARAKDFGQMSCLLGLLFSVFVTLLPMILCIAALLMPTAFSLQE